MTEMEEKKVYSIIGKVEIGTDEYRDLIEGIERAKHEAHECRSDYWKEQSKRTNIENELESTKKLLKKYQDFVNSDEALKEKMKSYYLQKTIDEMNETEKQ